MYGVRCNGLLDALEVKQRQCFSTLLSHLGIGHFSDSCSRDASRTFDSNMERL